MSEDLMEALGEEITLESFVPQYLNQAITFTGDDMGSDRAMITMLLYMIIVIIAFVFGITISNTIRKEAGVIGTLRASGYRYESFFPVCQPVCHDLPAVPAALSASMPSVPYNIPAKKCIQAHTSPRSALHGRVPLPAADTSNQ